MNILMVEDEPRISGFLDRGLRLGADDYLVKPFEFEQLLARIEALGRRGRMGPIHASALIHTVRGLGYRLEAPTCA